jgi:hypothetical protein
MKKRDVVIFSLILMILIMPAFVSAACIETDKGAPYDGIYEPGYIHLPEPDVTYYDECISSTHLIEYSCAGGGTSGEYFCENGCISVNGEENPDYCAETPLTCEETDAGEDYYNYGETTGYYLGVLDTYEDYCINGYKIQEYYCDGGIVSTNDYYCNQISGHYCDTENDECVGPGGNNYCTETDGGQNDIYNKGTVSGENEGGLYTKVDYCSSASGKLFEFYCLEDESDYDFDFLDCPEGYECDDGACVPEGSSVCGNNIIEGDESCDGTDLGGEDCESLLGEGYEGTLSCSGCSFDTSDCSLEGNSECIENDGGNQINYPGFVLFDGDEYRDRCITNSRIKEYFCQSGNVEYYDQNCADGYSCKSLQYQGKSYSYCKADTSGNSVNLLNGRWVNTGGSEISEISLSESQLGSSASRVGMFVNKENVNIGISKNYKVFTTGEATAPIKNTFTSSSQNNQESSGSSEDNGEDDKVVTITYDIYELDKFPGISIAKTFIGNTNSFLSIIGRVVGTSEATTLINYISVPTHIKTISTTMSNNQATAYWDISKSDILKAGSEDTYEFYFKVKVGTDEKSFVDKILNVEVDWGSEPGVTPSVTKKWLDKNQKSINSISIDWKDLTPSNYQQDQGGDEDEPKSSLTGNLVVGDAYLNYEKDKEDSNGEGTTNNKNNLLYMDASNLGVAPGTLVYFNVYEKDPSSEGGIDDNIRVSTQAIRVSADTNKHALAPIFLSQNDIIAASTGDGREIDGNYVEMNLELYYEIFTSNQNQGSIISKIKNSYNSFTSGEAVNENYESKTSLASGILYLTVFAYINNTSDTCTDSDGGLNYTVKGTVISTTEGTFPDTCIGYTKSGTSLLQEYACDGDQVIGVTHICETGSPCVNGACGGIPTNDTGNLSESNGMWKDKSMNDSITQFYWNEEEENVVIAFVSDIPSNFEGEEINFSIWETDSIYAEDLTQESSEDTTLNVLTTFTTNTNTGNIIASVKKLIISGTSVVDSNGEAYFKWDITEDDLNESGFEEDDKYEFYFGIKANNGESQIFGTKILNVYAYDNTSTECGNGICESGEDFDNCPEDCSSTGDDCEDVFYCSDHLSQNLCENPCIGALENEIQLNSDVDCSNESIDCACAWIDDECSFVYNEKEGFGSCLYVNGEIIDNCYNSGTLIMTYEAIWNWNEDNCYETKEECEEGFEDNFTFGMECINRESCWRQSDFSYDECKDYQETKDCSSSGEIDDDQISKKTEKKEWYTEIWFLVILAILIVLLILFLLWFLLRRKNKKSKEEKLFKNKNNLFNIMSYINNVKRKGMPDDQVKTNLKRSGWTPAQISYAMKKYSGKNKKKWKFKLFNKSKKPIKK